MKSSDLRMIDAQAALITKLNKELVKQGEMLDRLRDKVDREQPYVDFYRKLQETILSSPMLVNEWQSFLVMVKLIDPDEKKYDNVY